MKLLILCATLAAGCAVNAETLSDPGWPRSFSNGMATVVVYQPQVDAWTDFKKILGRCAIALTPARGQDPIYGSFRFEADTLVDTATKVVLLRNIRALDMRFPSAAGGAWSQWSELTRRLLPSDAIVVSLDRVLAFVHASEVPRHEAHVLTDPPPIFVSTQPAVLVIIDGEPVSVEVENTALRRVVNTNWDLYQDARTYYLRDDKSWLTASRPALAPSFEQRRFLPASLRCTRTPSRRPRRRR